jgi:hypothetical protein
LEEAVTGSDRFTCHTEAAQRKQSRAKLQT